MTHRRTLQPLVLFLCLLPAVAHSAGEADAQQWLERMYEAVHGLNYDGIFVYRHNDRLQSMRIVHGVDELGERERLVSLNGPFREVVRDNDVVTCMLPDDKSVVVQEAGPRRTFPLTVPTHIERLQRHYHLKLQGRDRVADLAARRVDIEPRDQFRYGYRYWLGEESGLLLRSELRDEGGEIIEELMFTQLQQYAAPPEGLLQSGLAEEGDMVWYRQNESPEGLAAQARRWTVADRPPGFELEVYREHFLPKREQEVEHLVFSDGLASVSVFVEEIGSERTPPRGDLRLGGVNAYVHLLEDGHRVTVVGEVPRVTVRMMAESVRLREESADD